ncbi:WG repeat-containing protein [Lacrimispora defluvii]|uniref:WG repeat-containing protein n=1 Tax=Lacrimispora defluvii TaxID=2719233 RepID=A0ABX1VV05_9FIRM|nr:WG repeat-containing protein [Lacrimispora defluvii]NNJ32260.1 WG repeat-containing protein [Lacrimispora defluvii]
MLSKVKVTQKVPCRMRYDDVWGNDNGFIKVAKDGMWGFIDQSGSEIIPLIYDSVGRFRCGLACVERFGLFGIIDRTGNEIIPCVYEEEFEFRSETTWAKRNGRYFLIDQCGAPICETAFDDIWSGFDDLCAVATNGKWGIISEITGELLIPQIYQQAYPLYHGLIRVKLQGRWGFRTRDFANYLYRNQGKRERCDMR